MASYRVEVTRDVHKEVRDLPGHVRQRVVRAMQALQQEPRPGNSKLLDTTNIGVPLQPNTELRRVRIESWRMVYFIEDEPKLISVLAIRKRPPYQYEDLEQLLKQ